MKIFEVANPDSQKLLALSQFLLGRADDTSATKQISQAAFIDLAKSLGVNVTSENLNQLINQDPLKNILEPIEPGSGVVRFRGNVAGANGMTVDQAQKVVDSNAKAALKRRMKESLEETVLPKAHVNRFRDAVLQTTDLTQKKKMIKQLIDLALIKEKDLYKAYTLALNQSQDPEFLNGMTDRVAGYYLDQTNQM